MDDFLGFPWELLKKLLEEFLEGFVEGLLGEFLESKRIFGGKSRRIRGGIWKFEVCSERIPGEISQRVFADTSGENLERISGGHL